MDHQQPPALADWPDILACERTVLRFTAAFDANDLDGMLAEFAPYGEWHRQDGLVAGHSGLRNLMATRSPKQFVRHIISNLLVVLAGPDKASCTSYVTVYRDDDGGSKPTPLYQPVLVGTYHDRLRKTEDVWRLTGRSVTVDFKKP